MLPNNNKYSNCQHVNESSPLTIRTLIKELKPGESLYVYKDSSGGKNDTDFVGVFTKFDNKEKDNKLI